MRDKNRIPVILDKLKEKWEKNPDLRFCQLLHNTIYPSTIPMFYLEDDILLELIEKDNI